MLVWGFTGGLIDLILDHSGLALPWDATVMVDLDVVAAMDEEPVTS
jgi:hypothetical protein